MEISLSPLVSVNVIYALSGSVAFYLTEPVEVPQVTAACPFLPHPVFSSVILQAFVRLKLTEVPGWVVVGGASGSGLRLNGSIRGLLAFKSLALMLWNGQTIAEGMTTTQ